METKIKEFKGTSWAIDNRQSIYLLAIILAIFGIINYNSIPKEQFPELVIPTIIVNTIYPGTSPSDIENLVTRPIEKNIKSINGVKNITSNSIQDFSSIVVEFDPSYDVAIAKQKVKDAVDRTKSSLPSDLLADPSVMEIDFSEIPIMYINLSGDIDLSKLKTYADDVQEKIESLKEITRVDIVGALDREIQVNVDMFKMQSASISFNDINRAIASENVTVSAGTINLQGMSRTIRVVGEFSNLETIRNIALTSSSGAKIKLSDIAEIKDGYKEKESYARLNQQNVVTLNVIKRSGENLLDAADKIKDILKDLEQNKFPEELNVTVSGDMSKYTKTTLKDLNNTIIIGFILVTLVLMFFMGLTNAIFVGLSVPLSMAIAYTVLPAIDFSMNMLVMFSFIFALGIVVDDAIVVIENTHRIFRQGKENNLTIVQAAKYAAGQVFVPVLSGTLTLLAPFFPLAFWPGIVGKFMHYIPITLIITLFASLIVAYIFNPVFAVSFMKHEDENTLKAINKRKVLSYIGLIIIVGTIFHVGGMHLIANVIYFIAVSILGHNFFGRKVLFHFQQIVIPGILNYYERILRAILRKRRPAYILMATIGLLLFSFILTGLLKPKVVFFPDNDPNNIMVYVKLPEGTEIKVTDSMAGVIENRIYDVIGKDNPNLESIVTNVARGASESMFDNTTVTSNKAKISINFVEFAKRKKGLSTRVIMDSLRNSMKDHPIPGVEITVAKNTMGPPTGKPVNIEITGDNLEELVQTTERFKEFVDSLEIEGIEELKSDFVTQKPEIIISVDRLRANSEGISTGQIGMELRTAIFGKEVSKFRDAEEQYPIQLRYADYQRKDIEKVLNTKITFMDMVTGRLRQIPLATVAKVEYKNTYGGIHRKDLKRIITLSSNVTSGHTSAEVTKAIIKALPEFVKSENVDIKLTGERDDQKDAMKFLVRAMLLSVFLIFFILVTQFRSLRRSMIILTIIIFSITGVLLGFSIFSIPISIIMTGMGIVALAGIVVRNGILMVEFIDALRREGISGVEAIVKGAKTRVTPIMLTATATILGLVPLAVGFNIDFVSLFTHFQPHIHFGGDNVMFFGPLSWTIIFGLLFATFLTLLVIPVLYKLYVVRNKD